MSFDYYQSVIGKMRKGTADDSFVDVNETLQVVNSKVVLSELPDKFNGLVVRSVFGNTTLFEIKKGTPVNNQYLCDYNLGVVHFPDTENGERYVFSYKGRGAVYLAADRIYSKQMNSNEIIQTLRDILDEADSIINLSERFTNTGDYSATKVYYGRNIVTYDNGAYMCINNSADGIINILPTDTTHWMEMVSVKQAVEDANAAASSANTAATTANNAADNAENQATYAKNQGDYAKNRAENFTHKGDYSPTATYKNGNVVTYGGINYFCIQDTTAGIDPLNGAYWTVVSPQASINDETWTATEGQTIFTITNGNYVVGQGNIEVFVGGVQQVSGTGYTETDTTSFTLSEGVSAGTIVFAKWFEGTMTITKGHKSSHNLGGQDEIDLTQLRNYKEKVSDEFSRVDAELVDNTNKIGELSTLQTSEKSSVVGAINEHSTQLVENAADLGVLLKRTTVKSILEFESYATKDANGIILDWAPAFNHAINGLSPTYGGVILVPYGEFPITTSIIYKDRVMILGFGITSSRIVVNADVTAFTVSTALAGKSIGRAGIKGIFIYYPSNTSGQYTNGNGISLVSSTDSRTIWKFNIQDVQMYQVPNRGISLVSSTANVGNYIAETYIRNVEIGKCKDGYYNDGKVYDTYADHLYVETASNYGIWISSGGSHTFVHSHVVKCGTNTNGTLSGGGYRINDGYCSFYDCHADKSVGHGFVVGGYDGIKRNNNRFVACMAFNSGSNHATDGVGFKVGAVGHLVLDACFSGTLSNEEQKQYTGIIFESPTTHSAVLQGCSFRDNANKGIIVATGVPEKVIQLGMVMMEGNGADYENLTKLKTITMS